MNRKGIKPGLGVRPQPGELKIKKKMLGGRRVWVIVKHGVATGLQYFNGQRLTSEIGPGQYKAERVKHPINPKIEAIKVYLDPEDLNGDFIYLIPETLLQQNVDFEIIGNGKLIISVAP